MKYITVMFFIGCGISPLPFTTKSKPESRGIDTVDEPSYFEEAYQIVKEEYELTYFNGEESNIEPNIYWVDGTCVNSNNEETDSFEYRGFCYNGLTFSCNEIYVKVKDFAYNTAMVHEIGHCYHLKIFDSGDGSHSDTLFWEENRKINKILIDMKL